MNNLLAISMVDMAQRIKQIIVATAKRCCITQKYNINQNDKNYQGSAHFQHAQLIQLAHLCMNYLLINTSKYI